MENSEIKRRQERISSIQLIGEPPSQTPPASKTRQGKGGFPNVNNFIQKTYAILQEKQYESIVSWGSDSDTPGSFLIYNVRAFEEVVLPKYFKHSNMSSFVRQLNMYSFHKVRGDRSEIQFQHDKFIKNRPQLLSEIKRKQVDSTTSIPSVPLIPQEPSMTILKQPEPLCPLPQSPKKESSGAPSNQQKKLSDLQEANKNLRKEKQMKSAQLKQLILESKTFVNEKFSKAILGLLAARIKGMKIQTKGSLQSIHKIIDHILNSNPPLPLLEYLRLGEQLLNGQEN